ncbi:Peroxisome chaperone and import receptor [Serendipita sp. 401]|nr:Peroxisome chaperone and import receptor [Serendipita sp. 397]KAG8828235.1 Peroxisome chaperone and import receptor [Serendipita sp. 401]KAG9058728.1 Peroxisome chaperone and import receptor [Serendipita sp. 407]
MSRSSKPIIEDDVDDLDDVLEQFNAPSTSTQAKPDATSKKSEKEEDISEEEFAQRFADEMEAFMKGLIDPEGKDSGPVDPEAAKQAEKLRKAWEQLLVEDLEGESDKVMEETMKLPSSSKSATSKHKSDKEVDPAKEEAEDEFQKAVKQAMDKLKASDESNKSDLGDGDLADLLSSFSKLNFDGDTDGNVQGVLETLMGQLMSKDILYEPLKELNEKFPEYLENNRGMIATEDQVRYDKQKSIVSDVVAIFEVPDYSDTNPVTTAEIVRLMSEMQEYGSPPAEIMGALPPGFDVGPDGLPSLEDKCIIV